jgi:hypothetical protein
MYYMSEHNSYNNVQEIIWHGSWHIIVSQQIVIFKMITSKFFPMLESLNVVQYFIRTLLLM